jgi:hypothetical protein
VENALVERHFYSIDTDDGRDPVVEQMLASHIEGPAARAVARVVDEGRSVSLPGLRGAISSYLAFQFVRGRAMRHAHVEFFKAQTRKISSLATPEMVKAELERQGEVITEQEAEDIVEFAQRGEYEIRVSSEANLHLGAALSTALDLIPFFARRKWILLEFESPVLITGDEPIALVGSSLSPGEPLGLYDAPEIVFPTDPRHALVMVRPDRSEHEGRFNGSPSMATIINRHIAFSCHHFVVRYPGTDPLKGLDVPDKATPVVTLGDHLILQPRTSVQGRSRWLRAHRKFRK